jgi:hypothetical protein
MEHRYIRMGTDSVSHQPTSGDRNIQYPAYISLADMYLLPLKHRLLDSMHWVHNRLRETMTPGLGDYCLGFDIQLGRL